MSVSLILPQFHKIISGKPEDTILDLLNKGGVLFYAPCGGDGVCGKCKVIVHGAVCDPDELEKKLLTESELKNEVRLACRTRILTFAEVILPDSHFENHAKELIPVKYKYRAKSRVSKKLFTHLSPTLENGYSIVESLNCKVKDNHIPLELLKQISDMDLTEDFTGIFYKKRLIAIENGNTTNHKYGIAIDIGTTTLACYLIDLNTGWQIAVNSVQNPQAGYGSDVVSRINFCIENRNGLELLSNCIRKGIDQLIKSTLDLVKVNSEFVYECVLVGNTAMNHLFLGLNPKTLSQIPFNPVSKNLFMGTASNFSFDSINKHARICFLPIIGGFVGADTIGCIIDTGLLPNKEKCRLLIDLGTNGEIVLSSPKGIFACSTAAGPAFEGANISCGMQAFEGAVNRFKINSDISFSTVNNKPAKGICGSGLIDIIAELLKVGAIDTTGRIVDISSSNALFVDRIIMKDGLDSEIIIDTAADSYNGENISITQKDIREVQLAKAAIMSGVRILMNKAEINDNDLDEILLAGAFGNFIDKLNARVISLFPNLPADKIKSIGNAAGSGAKKVLTDATISHKEIDKLAENIIHVELSCDNDFQNEFINNMLF